MQLQEGRVCLKPKRFAGSQWVQCLSDAQRLLIIHLAYLGSLQPTALMSRRVSSILNLTPLNRYPTERLLGHRCRQSGRCWEPDIRPERRGRGEGEEKTGQVKQKEEERQLCNWGKDREENNFCVEPTPKTLVEGEREWKSWTNLNSFKGDL